MFRLRQPTGIEIERQIEIARDLTPRIDRLLFADDSVGHSPMPSGFVRDFSQSRLGFGDRVFEAAKRGFAKWAQFDLGWARVANPEARISVGEIVVVEVRSLGLWSANLSKIVNVIDMPARFGFVYSTTELHVEQGEELFLLRMNEAGDVGYELEAYSRPNNMFARLGYPVTRAFQHRFAKGSHKRMRDAVIDSQPHPS